MQCKNGSIADRISILDTYCFENVGAARRMLACICSIMYMIFNVGMYYASIGMISKSIVKVHYLYIEHCITPLTIYVCLFRSSLF